MKQFFKFTLASIVGVLIAGVLLLFITIGVITAMVSRTDEPAQIPGNSVLLLKFDHEIVDRARKSPFGDLDFGVFQGNKTVGLNDILDCIRKAKTDNNIKGIYLNPMDIQAGMLGQRLNVEAHQAKEERLDGNNVGMNNELHAKASDSDDQQQGQHQMVRSGRDVADAFDQKTASPQAAQTSRHGETGVHSEWLRKVDPEPDRFYEVAQMPNQHQRQPKMEGSREDPDPQVALEQTLEKRNFAEHAQNDAACGGRRRRGRDRQRRRCAREANDLRREAHDENRRGNVEENREE